MQTREVGDLLERVVQRIDTHLRRRGLLQRDDDDEANEEVALAASAVSGQAPPAGPQWTRGLVRLASHALAYDKPLCASLDGFTLHAATRAGALGLRGREALLHYILRRPIAQERLERPGERPGEHRAEARRAERAARAEEGRRGAPARPRPRPRRRPRPLTRTRTRSRTSHA